MVAREEVLEAFRVDCTNWLREITIAAWICQIEHGRGGVLDDPREDRVLREVE